MKRNGLCRVASASALLVLCSSAALAQVQPPPCPNFAPPQLQLTLEDVSIEPDQPVPLSSIFKLVKANGRQPGWIALCARREPVEDYEIDGADWQPTNRTFEIACANIEGSNKSTGGNYSTGWNSMALRFPETARGKKVSLIDWTIVYELVGDDIPFGAWSCQSPIAAANIPVGFIPDLVILNPFALSADGGSISKAEVLARSKFLEYGRAREVSADETAAGLVVYRLGKDFDKPLQLTLTSPAGMAGTLDEFDSTFMSHGPQRSQPSLDIAPSQFIELTDALGQKSKFAFAVYRAPRPSDGLKLTGGATMTLTAINGADTKKVSMPVKAPPTILIHGLWGTDSTFSAWPRGEGGPPYQNQFYYHMLYDGSLSYAEGANQTALSSLITQSALAMKLQHVIGSRVDLVTHSMGGLMARQYLASSANTTDLSYGTSPVYRLVTIDTPHTGSPLAKLLYERRNTPIATPIDCNEMRLAAGEFMMCRAQANLMRQATLGNILRAAQHPIDTAVRDLQPSTFGAAPLASPGAATGGFMMVSGRASADDSLGNAIEHALRLVGALPAPRTISNVFEDDGEGPGLHDVIVGERSQRAFANVASFAPAPYTNNHIAMTNDPGVMADIWCWLRNGLVCGVAGSGTTDARRQVRAAKLTPSQWSRNLSGMTESAATATVNLDAPLGAGMAGSMFVNAPSKSITGAYLFSSSNLSNAELQYLPNPSGAEFLRFSSVPVPDDANLNVTFVVLFSDNSYGVYSSSFPIGVGVGYAKPAFTIPYLILPAVGATAQIGLIGEGTAGRAHLPLTDSPIIVNPAADPVVAVSAAGVVTALKAGSARIQTTVGSTRLTLPVTVGSSGVVIPEPPGSPNATLAGVTFEDSQPLISLTTSVNSAVDATLTLGNQGTVSLQVGAISWELSAASLSVTDNSCSNTAVAPSASCTFKVRFNPSSAGTVTGTVSIATNDSGFPAIPVKVSAVATASAPPPPPPAPPGGGSGSGNGNSGGGGGGGSFGIAEALLLLAIAGRFNQRRGRQRRA